MIKGFIDRALLIAILAAVVALYWQVVKITAGIDVLDIRLSDLENQLFSVEGRIFLMQDRLSELESLSVVVEGVVVDPDPEATLDP